jgi:hypothetical protein
MPPSLTVRHRGALIVHARTVPLLLGFLVTTSMDREMGLDTTCAASVRRAPFSLTSTNSVHRQSSASFSGLERNKRDKQRP